MLYKNIENGIITSLGESKAIPSTAVEITREEYDILIGKIMQKPKDTLEAVYLLSAEAGEYIAYERTHEETVQWYQEKVYSGMSIEEVPEEYRAEVQVIVTPEPSADYQAGYDQAVLDLMEV